MNSNQNPQPRPLGPLQRSVIEVLAGAPETWVSAPGVLETLGGGDTARLRVVHGTIRRLIALKLVKSKGSMHTRRFAATAKAKKLV